MSGKDDITTILAKANMLIYFSKLFKDNNNVNEVKNLSNVLLNNSFFSSKTVLGTLEKLEENKYDLILANPPYYQDKKHYEICKWYWVLYGKGKWCWNFIF